MRARFVEVLIVAAAVQLAMSQVVKAAPPPLPGWQVSWFDEFDGNQVNGGLWDVVFSTNPTNNSRQAYLPNQVSVGGGNLVITASNQPYAGLPYRSGQVTSKNQQQYGRWEVRAKLPTSRGMWPAIWLLPEVSQYAWPSQGEIDFMENRGDEPHMTSSAFHWGTNPPYSHDFVYSDQKAVHGGALQNYHNSFHTYAVEWEPSQIRFYVDDVHHFTVYDADTGGFLGQQSAGMELVLNTAVGGDFLDDPDGTTVWPQQFLIDYVHVYEPAATPAPMTFTNGDFEAHNGTLAGWSTFGNRIPNVQTNVEAVRSGSSSLKLFGQFNGAQNFSGVTQGITVAPGDELRAIARSFVRAADSIAGTNNELALKIDFYNTRHGEFGTAAYIGSQQMVLANGASPNQQWLEGELRATAPNGAVEARMALVFRQTNGAGGAVHVDDVLFGRRGDYTLSWNELGDGNWSDSRWSGAPLDVPTDFDRAIIRTNRVVVTGNQSAFETNVESGLLDLRGTLTSNVNVGPNGTITAGGSTNALVQGSIDIGGTQQIGNPRSALIVSGMASIDGARIVVGDDYQQERGTVTGDQLLLSAATVIGSYATTAASGDESHLGAGYFLNGISHHTDHVLVDIYAALPGDANGDGTVDGQDFIVWNNHKFQANTSWITGDFNGDHMTDGADFIIWNEYKFQSADFTSVPEPSAVIAYLIVFATGWRAWHVPVLDRGARESN